MIINKYIESMANSMIQRSSSPSYDVWPSPLANITVANDITGECLIEYLKLIFLNHNVDDLCSAFKHPSKITNYMYLFLLQPKNKKDSKQRVKTANKMLKVIKKLRCNDTFLSKKNIIRHFQNKVDTINLEFISDDLVIYVRKIIALLTIVNEYNYMAWTSLGKEIHGCYKNGNELVLLREFNNLKVDYWEFSKHIPWNSISIYTNDNMQPFFDFFGRTYYKNTEFSKYNKCFMELDGKKIELNEKNLKEIYLKLKECLKLAKCEVLNTNGKQLLINYGKGQFYCLNDVAKKLNLNINIVMPSDIHNKILNSSNTSSFDYIGKLLSEQTTIQGRKNILKFFLNPGKLNKYS